MRNLSAAVILVLIALCMLSCSPAPAAASGSVEAAFQQQRSNVQVTGSGTVERILRDDTSGLPHQRFIVRLASGQTVLIEHNIDVAPRIDGLKVGDEVSFQGEYVWNEQGGLVHWTHHDPARRHPGGWIERMGRTYE